MKIGFNPQINQQTKNTNFKSNITFDIGGSQREGSCKIYYASTPKDEEFYREHTTVNTLGKRMFADSDDDGAGEGGTFPDEGTNAFGGEDDSDE